MKQKTTSRVTPFPSFDDLVERGELGFAPAVKEGPRKRLRDIFQFGSRFWFGLIVLLPTVLTAFYFLIVAADQYYSEASFAVRSASRTQVSAVTDLLRRGMSGGGGSGALTSNRSDDDAYAVKDYILSRDAVARLDKNIGLRALLDRPEADIIARFPRLPFWNSFEDLYKAYHRFVDVTYDDTSGISTIGVTAFRPEDAQKIAATLLSYAEGVVNQMNDRAEHDAISVAQREIDQTQQRFAQAQTAMAEFRNVQMMVDPTDQTKEVMAVVVKLSEDAALRKAQLMGLLRTSPNSPDIPRLQDQIQALDEQIVDEQRKMTGSDSSIASHIAEYQRLKVAEELAQSDLAAAHDSFRAARLQAEQQHLYLEPIVRPIAADYPLYPRTLAIIASVFFVSLIVFGLGWLLVAGAREHIQ